MEEVEKDFICPECACKEFNEQTSLSKVAPDRGSDDPWDSVLEIVKCNECKMIIPEHLGFRWEEISYEEAISSWKKLYKKNSLKQIF